jgi:hypothetical protein
MEIGGPKGAAILSRDEGWAPVARIIADTRPLNLDDLCAEIREQLSGPRSGENAGKFENADPGERFRGHRACRRP